MNIKINILPAMLVMGLLVLAACGGNSDTQSDAAQTGAGDQSEAAGGLSPEELEHGIGPIAAFDPGPIDAALAERGAELFRVKCSSCHKMDGRYVGPALGKVTQERTSAYIMNMILNPQEMITTHPEAKKKFAEFLTPMPNKSLSEDDARAVLEFLRQQ